MWNPAREGTGWDLESQSQMPISRRKKTWDVVLCEFGSHIKTFEIEYYLSICVPQFRYKNNNNKIWPFYTPYFCRLAMSPWIKMGGWVALLSWWLISRSRVALNRYVKRAAPIWGTRGIWVDTVGPKSQSLIATFNLF